MLDGRVKVPVLEIVPITGAVNVLLVRVSAALSVTTTPDVGNVAVEFTPVPPTAVAKVPLVICAADRFGISAAVRLVAEMTRPFASTVTLI